jgi:peroxiredoxin
MAETPSNMPPLGMKAPDFTLPDTVSGKMLSLSELSSKKATVIMFICNHCPYVKYINSKLVEIASEFQKYGVSFVAINSNDIKNYPEDSPENMKIAAENLGYSFPYLFDESQEVAKAYKAACTPDFYVFDRNMLLAYRGQFDASRPGSSIPVTGKDLRNALTAILEGMPIQGTQHPSIGCNIKWKR